MILRALFTAMPAGTFDRLPQAVVVDRFQQVVEGIRIKRPERKLVVGRDENNLGHVAARQATQYLETIHPRHLHVQEHEIRRLLANG